MLLENKCEISVVVPVYNESKTIKPFLNRCVPVLKSLNVSYEIVFAIDPSVDGTEELVHNCSLNDRNIRGIVFSRRFGQPAATIAGIQNSVGRCVVVIDVDLQDPPELIINMYEKFLEGNEVVYAKRTNRKGETIAKRILSAFGYFIINKFSDVNIPRDTGDFRIISRRVADIVVNLKESHGFLRGLVAFAGFKQDYVLYDRDERIEGMSKYNKYTGSIKIGLNGLISFSTKPLFAMCIMGFFIAFLSFIVGLFYLFQKISGYDITPGLSTTVLMLTFLSGVQLAGLGILGEYVGRIYDEVKCRPMYIVEREIKQWD